MDIEKALGIAKSLKNHFRAFEDLDGFVKAVAATHANLEELESKRGKLQSEIKALEAERDGAEKTTESFKVEKERQTKAVLESLNADLLKAREKTAIEMKKLEAGRSAMEAALEGAETKHSERMDQIRAETDVAEGTLKNVEAKIRVIKSKLE